MAVMQYDHNICNNLKHNMLKICHDIYLRSPWWHNVNWLNLAYEVNI